MKEKVNVTGFALGHAKLTDLSFNFVKEKVNVMGFACDHAQLHDPN